jgi:hypothetical protein
VPDDVVPWLSPLLQSIRHKYRHPESPLGLALHDVAEFRVEAVSWSARPIDLTLHVILRAGTVPGVGDPKADPALIQACTSPEGGLKGPSEVARLLVDARNSQDKATLWGLLADSLASSCIPRPKDMTDAARGVVQGGIVAELWTDDEFPLSRIHKSEVLDVDYLSEDYPL